VTRLSHDQPTTNTRLSHDPPTTNQFTLKHVFFCFSQTSWHRTDEVEGGAKLATDKVEADGLQHGVMEMAMWVRVGVGVSNSEGRDEKTIFTNK